MKRAGAPAHSWPEGTTVPGVTSAPAATIAPFSTTAPSITVAPIPTKASSWIVHAWRMALWPTVTRSPTVVGAATPPTFVFGDADDGVVLDVGHGPDGDAVGVAAEDRAVPYGRLLADGDVADDGGGGATNPAAGSAGTLS